MPEPTDRSRSDVSVRPPAAFEASEMQALVPDPSFSRALLRVAAALDEARVGYALIGAVAMQIRCTTIRPTENIDFAVLNLADVPRRGLRAARFTFYQHGAHNVSWRAPAEGPSATRIVVRFFTGATRFEQTIVRAETVELDGVSIPVATPEDLLILKVAAAEAPARRKIKRTRDLEDIVQLTREHPSTASAISGLERRRKVLRGSTGWDRD